MEFYGDYAGAIFINDIITKILKLKITSEDYKKLCIGSDRNIFYTVVYRKTKNINEVVKEALIKLILIETKKDPKKIDELYKYFEAHLTKDIIKMIEETPNNLKKILDSAVSKFTSKNSVYNKKSIPLDILTIDELFYKSVVNLKKDIDVVSFFVDKLFQKIFIYITKEENDIKNIDNIDKKTTNILLYKKLIQKDVLILMESTRKMLITNATEKLLISIFTNLKLIIQWFFIEYLNDELHFVTIMNKVENEFYNLGEEENIQILSVNELLDMNWSYKEIAEKTTQLFNKNVPVRTDNNTNLQTKISRMKHLPEARKVILLENQVIGTWHFYTLFDEDFDIYINSKTSPETRSVDKMPIPIGGAYNVVFGAVILESKYRKTKVFKKLLYSILNYIEKLSIEGSYIKRIAAKSETKEGQALIKTIGLKVYKKQDENVDTYVGTIYDLLDKYYLKDYQILKDNYNNFFKNANP